MRRFLLVIWFLAIFIGSNANVEKQQLVFTLERGKEIVKEHNITSCPFNYQSIWVDCHLAMPNSVILRSSMGQGRGAFIAVPGCRTVVSHTFGTGGDDRLLETATVCFRLISIELTPSLVIDERQVAAAVATAAAG